MGTLVRQIKEAVSDDVRDADEVTELAKSLGHHVERSKNGGVLVYCTPKESRPYYNLKGWKVQSAGAVTILLAPVTKPVCPVCHGTGSVMKWVRATPNSTTRRGEKSPCPRCKS